MLMQVRLHLLNVGIKGLNAWLLSLLQNPKVMLEDDVRDIIYTTFEVDRHLVPIACHEEFMGPPSGSSVAFAADD